MRTCLLALSLALAALAPAAPILMQAPPKGIRLSELAWPEAETALRPDTVVVIPIGAGSKEHGPHLKLGNDLTLADYFTRRVVDSAAVVVAPTLTYHFYPAFLEYPGSTSLNLDTAKTMTLEVVRSLAHYGPRRFYALNTGVSTARALQQAATTLADEGVLLGYTDLAPLMDRASATVRRQTGGSHADEIETSMMLYIDPAVVDMPRAVKEFTPGGTASLRLTRQRGTNGSFSASGVWGDPTLATREKGAVVVEGVLKGMLDDIETVRRSPLPAPSQTNAPRPAPTGTPSRLEGLTNGGCTTLNERAILNVAIAYTTHWNNGDAEMFSSLWTEEGDIVHPEGLVERSRKAIFINRTELFRRKEYRGSKHFLSLGFIRCLTPGIAVADGKWELRGVSDATGKVLPPFEGQCTLVVRGGGTGWAIEAYRFTIKPSTAVLPTWLKRPGWPEIR